MSVFQTQSSRRLLGLFKSTDRKKPSFQLGSFLSRTLAAEGCPVAEAAPAVTLNPVRVAFD